MQQPKTQQQSTPERATIGFAFSLAGGLLILLRGLFRIIVGDILVFTYSDVFRHRFLAAIALSVLGGIAVAFGIAIIVGAYLMYTGMETAGGIIVLIFSVLSIFVGSGWLIGLILGVIGGILGLLKK
ncbi:MAG TPA: hypothetical protein VK536_07235 [Candidatus Limnocylindrales bacterium]|nr:hypothetical protein [Candidatus Limnocylindrales bacterium]